MVNRLSTYVLFGAALLGGAGSALALSDTTPPGVPANLQGQMNGATYAGLSWAAASDNAGVAGYRIFRDGVLLASVPETRYQDWNVAPGGSYSYTVAAVDGSGNVSAASSALVLSAAGGAALLPEFWAGLNKDGNWRNSNTRSLKGNLHLRWARALQGFYPHYASYADPNKAMGQRSNTLSIRDGRILLIVPSADPDTKLLSAPYASMGLYALKDGSLLNSVITPHLGAGAVMVPSLKGIMDSDTPAGVINQYWGADDVVYTMHGSDENFQARFSPYSGEIPLGSVARNPSATYNDPRNWAGNRGFNASGYFAMSNSNPLIFAVGGSSGHQSIAEPGSAGLLNLPLFTGIASMKHYASVIAEGDWLYALTVTNNQTDTTWISRGYGVKITGVELLSSPLQRTVRWTYSDPNKGFLGFGHHHAQGAPRAYALGEDGRIYYYGYHTSGSGSTQAPDFAKGMVLVGVPSVGGATRGADLEIPIAYTPQSESTAYSGGNLAVLLFPQIATRDRYVVVFQPQQADYGKNRISNGHLFVFDTVSRKQLSRVDFPSAYFATNVIPSDGHLSYYSGFRSLEQAVQMSVAGDSAYVVEPRVLSGRLQLRVERIVLASGVRTTTTLALSDAAGQPIAIKDATSVALRELAAVDGTLTALVDYDQFNQALAVIDGDANPVVDFRPVAAISQPTAGLPYVRTLSDAPRPSNQYDTGVPIHFSARGSIDPDGGALGYTWDFGDGTTQSSGDIEVDHVYWSSGSPGLVQARSVSLSVTDNEGNVSPAVSKTLLLRDVGNANWTTLLATADASVAQARPSVNYGRATTLTLRGSATDLNRGYLRFDLGGIAPSRVVEARLRLWSKPAAANTVGPLNVRAVGNDWDEATMTWSSAPAPGEVVGQYSFPAGQPSRDLNNFLAYVEVPVTAYVQGASGATLSFELEMGGTDAYARYFPGSKEGGHAPQLVLLIN